MEVSLYVLLLCKFCVLESFCSFLNSFLCNFLSVLIYQSLPSDILGLAHLPHSMQMAAFLCFCLAYPAESYFTPNNVSLVLGLILEQCLVERHRLQNSFVNNFLKLTKRWESSASALVSNGRWFDSCGISPFPHVPRVVITPKPGRLPEGTKPGRDQNYFRSKVSPAHSQLSQQKPRTSTSNRKISPSQHLPWILSAFLVMCLP